MNIPAWLTEDAQGRWHIDSDGAYPEWMGFLGLTNEDLDRYWLEVLFQCAKMDAQVAVRSSGDDPRMVGKGLILVVDATKAKKQSWAQINFPVETAAGRRKREALMGENRKLAGPDAATKGKEARALYRKIRGFVPE